MAKYQYIMKHLNPKVIIEKCEMPHDTARAKFTLKSSLVKNYLEFENALISYVAHHMQETFGHYPPPEFCLDKARKFLESSSKFNDCVFISMSGTNGGLPYILTKISEGFKEEAKHAYFIYVINTFIDPLSWSDVVECMRELKDKLGGYSPQAFQYIEPEAMAANYKEILWSYIESLTKYKNLWAY